MASANIDQSVPNLATIYMPIRSQMSLIVGQIEKEHPELFARAFGKIAESDFVYTWTRYVFALKVSDEFGYGTNQTTTSEVICP